MMADIELPVNLTDYEKEIERLKYEVKHWKEARDVALAGVELLRDELKTLKDELNVARKEIDRLHEEASTLSKDAQRWRYLERNASIGFTGPPSCDVVVRLKVFNSLDNTLSKIVDRSIAESKMTNESSEIGNTTYPVMYTASHVRSSSPTSGGGFIGKKIYVGK
jgi:DNA repair exonuclease SbcCD ATPase subunit